MKNEKETSFFYSDVIVVPTIFLQATADQQQQKRVCFSLFIVFNRLTVV